MAAETMAMTAGAPNRVHRGVDHLELGEEPGVNGAPAWASNKTANARASSGWRPARPR